jgi:DNA repair photolyase
VYAAISFTITTADNELGNKVEPGAPLYEPAPPLQPGLF